MNGPEYVAQLRADVERFARALERGPLDAPVDACPGWDVARLASHLGSIHRWARAAVLTASPPEIDPDVPTDDADLATWIRAGGDALAAVLEQVDPAAPTWHPFPVERVAGVWPRRQAIETAIHRWDAETAIGLTSTIDAVLASDGIDEYFSLGLPRLRTREGITLPVGSLHVHCTDVPGEWLVRKVGGELELRREHAKGDAALRGPADAILLRLWGRGGPQADDLEIVGDIAVAEEWLSLRGL